MSGTSLTGGKDLHAPSNKVERGKENRTGMDENNIDGLLSTVEMAVSPEIEIVPHARHYLSEWEKD